MVNENALGFDSISIPFPMVCVSSERILSISFCDLPYRKNGDSLFGFALPQKLDRSHCFVSNESGVDDRDLDIVLHVAVVFPYSFPQGPCKTERR